MVNFSKFFDQTGASMFPGHKTWQRLYLMTNPMDNGLSGYH